MESDELYSQRVHETPMVQGGNPKPQMSKKRTTKRKQFLA